MKRFSEQLQKKADNIRLSASEKRDLRERVCAYMEYHPLPVAMRETTAVEGKKNTTVPVQLVHVNGWRFVQGLTAVLGVLVLSITYLAERSVPGDTLYAVKVSFNEELRSTLARNSYDKVVWETERLNRRIGEARLLASEGRLTEEVETAVAEAVREHSANARREIAVLQQIDKEEAALATLQLDTTIELQAESLIKNSNNQTALIMDTDSTSLIATALVNSQVLAESQKTEEATLPSYTRLLAHVEQETTRAYELLTSVRKNAALEEQSDIKRRLEDVERVITEAAGLTETDDLLARSTLVEVLQKTQRLIVFMTNIDIRSNVTVEEVVPVTLTPEERTVALVRQAREVMAMSEILLPLMTATTTAPELTEKLAPAILDSVTVASSTLSNLPISAEFLSGYEAQVSNAHAIMLDAFATLGLDRFAVELPVEDKESGEGEFGTDLPGDTASSTATSTATSTSDRASTTDDGLEIDLGEISLPTPIAEEMEI